METGTARSEQFEPKGPPIGIESVIVRRAVIDLSVARDNVPLELAGRFIWAASSVLNTANVDVRFSEPDGDAVNFRRGHSIKRLGFHRLYLTNTAQAGASITLHTCMDPRLDITNASVDTSITQVVANSHNGAAQTIGVAESPIGTATAGLVRQRIFCATTNTGLIYLGPTGVTTANGFGPFAAGDVVEIETSVQLYAISDTAAQAIRYLESRIS